MRLQVALEAVNEGMEKLQGLEQREAECAEAEADLTRRRSEADAAERILNERRAAADARESALMVRTEDAAAVSAERERVADREDARLQQVQVWTSTRKSVP